MLAGCALKPPSSPPAGKEKAADPKAASAALPDSDPGFTLRGLCRKYVKENKASDSEMTQEDVDHMLLQCMMEATGRENKNNKESETIYAEHILKTCEGKSADEWLKCYYAEVPNAHDMQKAKKK